MTSNTAAWITAAKAKPLEVKSAPLGVPGEDQVLVKNHAIAINPIDGKLQHLAFYPLNYPTILGEDVAGEIVAVGPNVTRFKKGDRVIGTAAGFGTKRNEENAFQAYTILQTNLTSEIPDHLSFESAVVLPLGLATASSGLFTPNFLNLQMPTEPARPSTGKSLLIWGGASSVGSNAIQLAVAAGYEVITTASPKNFEYVKKLGASHAIDYNSPDVVSDLVSAFEGKTSVGAFDAVGGSAWAHTVEFIQMTQGVKFVATVIPGFATPPGEITMKQVAAISIKDNHVGKAVFEDFLPKALKAEAYIPAPDALIAGKGLESVQGAIDLQRKGTSAQKVVVLL
jgi:NADPH:quinone reductase-like Zn-dependent oxidoreductase